MSYPFSHHGSRSRELNQCGSLSESWPTQFYRFRIPKGNWLQMGKNCCGSALVFYVDPDPAFFLNGDREAMPIHMRILPQVLHMLDNREIFVLLLWQHIEIFSAWYWYRSGSVCLGCRSRSGFGSGKMMRIPPIQFRILIHNTAENICTYEGRKLVLFIYFGQFPCSGIRIRIPIMDPDTGQPNKCGSGSTTLEKTSTSN